MAAGSATAAPLPTRYRKPSSPTGDWPQDARPTKYGGDRKEAAKPAGNAVRGSLVGTTREGAICSRSLRRASNAALTTAEVQRPHGGRGDPKAMHGAERRVIPGRNGPSLGQPSVLVKWGTCPGTARRHRTSRVPPGSGYQGSRRPAPVRLRTQRNGVEKLLAPLPNSTPAGVPASAGGLHGILPLLLGQVT